jgi:hypothetical protein
VTKLSLNRPSTSAGVISSSSAAVQIFLGIASGYPHRMTADAD